MKSSRLWIVPAALVALVLLAILALDLAEGGAARTPDEYLGAAPGEQFPFVPPTATPTGPRPTPRPTLGAAGGAGAIEQAAERDRKRREDLILLLGAAADIKKRDGSYPSSNGNVQTLCNYQNADVGCAFREVLDPLPFDPSRDPVKNGYWYASDGKTAKFFAALEVAIPEADRCPTQDAELKKREILICVEAR